LVLPLLQTLTLRTAGPEALGSGTRFGLTGLRKNSARGAYLR
jgi:hypothetical protein